jgi:mRNA interferase HicA
MKRTTLMKHLRKIAAVKGLELLEAEGANHSKVWVGSIMLVVPRHREVNELTALAILRQAEQIEVSDEDPQDV